MILSIIVALAAQAAPPVISASNMSSAPSDRYPVEVDVHAGPERLYAGTLSVGFPVTSSFRQEMVEAAAPLCAAEEGDDAAHRNAPARAAIRNASFQILLNPAPQANRLQVTVRWTRPTEGNCGGRSSARTVELTDWVALPPGGSATLSGDAGLVIRLTRR